MDVQEFNPNTRPQDFFKNRRRMAWASWFVIVVLTFTVVFFLPEERVHLLSAILPWPYMFFGGIVCSYYGFSALVDRTKITEFSKRLAQRSK